jgi:hypothetical protein
VKWLVGWLVFFFGFFFYFFFVLCDDFFCFCSLIRRLPTSKFGYLSKLVVTWKSQLLALGFYFLGLLNRVSNLSHMPDQLSTLYLILFRF